jgi:tetratricopeptide (TPR) repeat protein
MSPELMSRLTLEDDNLRAANTWSTTGSAVEYHRASMALRFAGASFWYWHGSAGWIGTSRYGELRKFVQAALERGEGESPMLYARAVLSAGLLCLVSGSWADAESTLREARRLFGHLGAVELETVAEVKLGATLLMMGRLDEAWSAVTSAAELAQPLAPSIVHGLIVSWRGVIARARGDLPLARQCQQENVALANALGIRIGLGHAHAFLGAINVELGWLDEAIENFRIAAAVHLDLRDAFGIALDLEGLSGVALGRGDHHTAAVLLGAADAWRSKTGVALPTFDAHDRSRRVSRTQAALGAAYDSAYQHGRSLSPEAAEALVLAAQPALGAARVSRADVW